MRAISSSPRLLVAIRTSSTCVAARPSEPIPHCSALSTTRRITSLAAKAGSVFAKLSQDPARVQFVGSVSEMPYLPGFEALVGRKGLKTRCLHSGSTLAARGGSQTDDPRTAGSRSGSVAPFGKRVGSNPKVRWLHSDRGQRFRGGQDLARGAPGFPHRRAEAWCV